MKTVLPLGKDPPAITSMCFNHNGKILAAAATDGMIHMFGILPIHSKCEVFLQDYIGIWWCMHDTFIFFYY